MVEVDGWRFHKTKRAFEADRRKDARLVIAGRRVVRFSAERVFGQPAAVARELSLLLDGAPPLSARTELERPWLLPERSDP